MCLFQSTRPIRGATLSSPASSSPRSHFNPRAPYGARLTNTPAAHGTYSISIHAPHTGRDKAGHVLLVPADLFQSTRPIRGATVSCLRTSPRMTDFNPRAPYGARQAASPDGANVLTDFNPRAPYGARLAHVIGVPLESIHFNPRAPYGARLK